MINILKDFMGKVNNMQGQMGNFSSNISPEKQTICHIYIFRERVRDLFQITE